MILRFTLIIFILFFHSNVFSVTFEVAAIDITNIPEHKNPYTFGNIPEHRAPYVFEDKNKPIAMKEQEQEKGQGKQNNKLKIISSEKKTKAIEGYQTTIDNKGNKTREYVHGEVEKSKRGIYTGYLYGKDNKKTFTYGNPSSGVMQTSGEYGADITIESESKPDGHY